MCPFDFQVKGQDQNTLITENGTCFSFTSIVMKHYTKTLPESMGAPFPDPKVKVIMH